MNRREFISRAALAGSASVLGPVGVSCARQGGEAPSRRGKPAPGEARGRKGSVIGSSGPSPKEERALVPDPPRAGSRTRVVLVEGGAAAMSGANTPRPAVVGRMLSAGLTALVGVKDVKKALAAFLRPVDTVGLKVNCLAGRQMSTHPALVEQLVGLMARAGLPRDQAIVFDRSDEDLRSGGFEPRTATGKDYRCMGNDRAGYERELRVMPSGASRCSVVAARRASVLINLPILKDHGLAGVSGALKNNFGLVHNPNKFHLNGCDPHVAEVNALSFVRRKQRLVICDALRVQLDGGPAYHPAAAHTHGALLLATDPVALDMVAWDLLERLRKARKMKPLARLKRRPVHILTAARAGLGIGDRKRIDLVRISV